MTDLPIEVRHLSHGGQARVRDLFEGEQPT